MKNIMRNGTVVRVSNEQTSSADTFVPKKFKFTNLDGTVKYCSTIGMTSKELGEVAVGV